MTEQLKRFSRDRVRDYALSSAQPNLLKSFSGSHLGRFLYLTFQDVAAITLLFLLVKTWHFILGHSVSSLSSCLNESTTRLSHGLCFSLDSVWAYGWLVVLVRAMLRLGYESFKYLITQTPKNSYAELLSAGLSILWQFFMVFLLFLTSISSTGGYPSTKSLQGSLILSIGLVIFSEISRYLRHSIIEQNIIDFYILSTRKITLPRWNLKLVLLNIMAVIISGILVTNILFEIGTFISLASLTELIIFGAWVAGLISCTVLLCCLVLLGA